VFVSKKHDSQQSGAQSRTKKVLQNSGTNLCLDFRADEGRSHNFKIWVLFIDG
jgi:hypothetical protein